MTTTISLTSIAVLFNPLLYREIDFSSPRIDRIWITLQPNTINWPLFFSDNLQPLTLYHCLLAFLSSFFAHFLRKTKKHKSILHLRRLLNRKKELNRKLPTLSLTDCDSPLRQWYNLLLTEIASAFELYLFDQEKRAAAHLASTPRLFHSYIRRHTKLPLTHDSMIIPFIWTHGQSLSHRFSVQ